MEIISEPVIRKRADVESDHDDKHHRKKRHKTHHEDRSNSHRFTFMLYCICKVFMLKF